FGRKNRTLLIDCERMWVEMPSFVPRWSLQGADDFSVMANFQNLASDCVGHVDKMIRCDKEAEGVTDFPFAKVSALEIENLDAPFAGRANINKVTRDCDGVWRMDSPGGSPFHPQTADHIAEFIKFQYARIPLAVSDVNISFSIESHVGRLIKV